MRQRCKNPKAKGYKYYGQRGIKIHITWPDLVHLYFRDQADQMEKPSIDRIDATKHYIYNNCHFIEHNVNCKKHVKS